LFKHFYISLITNKKLFAISQNYLGLKAFLLDFIQT